MYMCKIILTGTEWIAMSICHLVFRRSENKRRVKLVNYLVQHCIVIQINIATAAIFLC